MTRGRAGAEPKRGGPLSSISIVDLTRLAPGPYATMLLGDLGADVVTIEPPAAQGSVPSEWSIYGAVRARTQGIYPLFRSRRSIVVDLKSPEGLSIVDRLVHDADVFVEGFRPGTCKRLGLDYDRLSGLNPRLIYCSITGYGQKGPHSQKPGHDLTYLAESGVLSLMARGSNPPGIPLNLLADFAAGGMMAAFGILAALWGRSASGTGAYVDVSMVQNLLSMLSPAMAWAQAGAPEGSWGTGMLNGGVPFYDCYRTKDDRWIAVGGLERKFFGAMCDVIHREDLIPMYDDPGSWQTLRRELQSVFLTRNLDQWLAAFGPADVAVAPVRSVADAFRMGRDAGMVSASSTVGPVPSIQGWTAVPGPVSRVPGSHTREILGEVGFTEAEIDGFVDRQTVVVGDRRE